MNIFLEYPQNRKKKLGKVLKLNSIDFAKMMSTILKYPKYNTIQQYQGI